MKRKEFLYSLKNELKKHRDIEAEELIFYYDELIQDAVDNGENEEVFIINLGPIKDIIRRLEDDESFIQEVKSTNRNVVEKTLGISVKIIAYLFVGLISFVISIAAISIFISGISIVVAIIVRLIYLGHIDVYGYIAHIGLVMIGFSLALFSVGLIKWHFTRFNAELISMYRKTRNLLKRKGTA